jgi:HSP20 family protein
MNTLLPMARAFDAAFNTCHPVDRSEDAQTTVTPRADILEGDKEFQILIDLPGVTLSNLDISVEDQTLTVKAARRAEVPEGFQTRRHERYGQVDYVRTFNLGKTIEVDGIGAGFTDGVLKISLPKSEKGMPRRIEIK